VNAGDVEVDAVLSALHRVRSTLRGVEGRIKQILDAIDSHTGQRHEGKDWRVVACVEAPPLVDLLNGIATEVAHANAAYRVALARSLHEESLSMERIATVLGVSRQRVSALLKSAR
jgi:hypothetical protein